MRKAALLIALSLAAIVGVGVVLKSKGPVPSDAPLASKDGAAALSTPPTPNPPQAAALTSPERPQPEPPVGADTTGTPDVAERLAMFPPAGGRANLWTDNTKAGEVPTQGKVPARRLKADPRKIAELDRGSPVDVFIPQTGRSLTGVVEEVFSSVPGVSTVDITFEGVDDIYTMQLNRGQIETHGWVATPEGVFTLRLDADTGQGTLVRERDVWASKPESHEDAVIPPAEERTRPPRPPL